MGVESARGDWRLLVVHDWLAAPHLLSPERREPHEDRCMERGRRASVLALALTELLGQRRRPRFASSNPVMSRSSPSWSAGLEAPVDRLLCRCTSKRAHIRRAVIGPARTRDRLNTTL
jgi:hypothetical protein